MVVAHWRTVQIPKWLIINLFTPRYSWNIVKIGVKHQSINQKQSLIGQYSDKWKSIKKWEKTYINEIKYLFVSKQKVSMNVSYIHKTNFVKDG